MTDVDLPDNYKWRLGWLPFGLLGVRVKLKRHLFWIFWETVEESYALVRDDESVASAVTQTKYYMWRDEQRRRQIERETEELFRNVK